MTYRETMIEIIKIACRDVIDRVDDLVPKSDGLFNVDLVIHIPSITDDPDCIPTIKLNTEGYTTRLATEKIIDLMKY